MKQVKTMPRAEPSTGQGQALMRHIVKLDDQGAPSDECLCGHVWDRVFLGHSEEICQECVDIQREIMRQGA